MAGKVMVLRAADVEAVRGAHRMPKVFRPRFDGRLRARLGDALGLGRFGVNIVTLEPGASSSVRHWHTREDEFVYVLSGAVTLVTDAGRTELTEGMCAGFPGGVEDGHCLVNEGSADAVVLEVGDRDPQDDCYYPDDDMRILHSEGGGVFEHRDGTPYEM